MLDSFPRKRSIGCRTASWAAGSSIFIAARSASDPTVHDDTLTCYETRIVAQQKPDDRADIVDSPQSSEGRAIDNLAPLIGSERRRHFRLQVTRTDRVHVDLPPPDFASESARHAIHAGLGRRVCGQPGIATQTDDRGDIDNAPSVRP